MNHQPTEPSAFSQYLATNYPRKPEYVVRDPTGEVLAAKWRRPASSNRMQRVLAQHTLMYHAGGSTSVAKFVAGRCLGTRSTHGSLTFSPRDEASEWIRGGVCEMLHIYISPALIRQYSDENYGCSAAPEIEPLFGVHDPWLQSYFSMLQSELEIFSDGKKELDALLLTQSMELLIRHLVSWHSNLSQVRRRRALARTAVPHPLAPRDLARVLDYIEINLTRNIALSDLAQLVGVSKYNFIRSFHAATQRTPYAYLVAQRLGRAVEALRSGTLSVEQIGREAGFKSTPGFSNVFKKHYGMSPSDFRTRAQRTR